MPILDISDHDLPFIFSLLSVNCHSYLGNIVKKKKTLPFLELWIHFFSLRIVSTQIWRVQLTLLLDQRKIPLQIHFCLIVIIDVPDAIISQHCIDTDNRVIYSGLTSKSDRFEEIKLASDLKMICCLFNCAKEEPINFNATKSKLFSIKYLR